MTKLLKKLLEGKYFQNTIISLILLNAIILGMETCDTIMVEYGDLLHQIDHIILWIFVGELSLKLLTYRVKFFRDPWNWFDTFVVGIALVPVTESLAVLRALRILRVLRLFSMVPAMRRVIEGLLRSLPGIGSIVLVMSILFYVFSVMGVKLYGDDYPQWFGTLGTAMYTLFQVMTLEGWAEIANTMLVKAPYSWVYLVIYILIATFAMLNLFIAVIVNAMSEVEEEADTGHKHLTEATFLKEIRALKTQIQNLKGKKS